MVVVVVVLEERVVMVLLIPLRVEMVEMEFLHP